MRRFYAPMENFSGDGVVLDADETRHLRDVLRLKIGVEAQVFDGEGREFLCEIESVEKKRTVLRILREIEAAPESKLDLILAAAITKADKFDLVVQKAVELGVNRIVPIFTTRCDIRSGGEKRLERWRKIALEAAKQSGRARLTLIDDPIDFQKFVGSASRDEAQAVVLFSEREGRKFEDLKSAQKILAFIGPEGGWDDSELDLARERRFQIITFGGRILRAETAAIALTALLQNRFGDLN